jgi:hypothetical protein
METNYLSQLNVVLRELITAECQAMKAEVQGRKADAERTGLRRRTSLRSLRGSFRFSMRACARWSSARRGLPSRRSLVAQWFLSGRSATA